MATTTTSTTDQSETLSTIVQFLIVSENPKPVALQACTMLKRICENALKPDEKFKRLPAGNKNVKEKVTDVVGGKEFLDAIGFIREAATGDLILQYQDDELLNTASVLLESVVQDLQPETGESTTPSPPAPTISRPPATSTTPSPVVVVADKANEEYLARKKLADQRAAELKAQADENRKKKELLRKQMLIDQKEVYQRQVVASVRQDYKRFDGASAGGGGGSGAGGHGGSIPYIRTDSELDKLIRGPKPVLVNFTAGWCGPCTSIAPQIEEMSKSTPAVTFVKVDVDENVDSASRFEVGSLPTFILFKGGRPVGTVKGANVPGVKQLVG